MVQSVHLRRAHALERSRWTTITQGALCITQSLSLSPAAQVAEVVWGAQAAHLTWGGRNTIAETLRTS